MIRVREFLFFLSSAVIMIIIIIFKGSKICEYVLLAKIKTSRVLPDLQMYDTSLVLSLQDRVWW